MTSAASPASRSVSFRITRTTEEMAQTIASLSQRLIDLESRLSALEQDIRSGADQADEDMTILDGIDGLLQDCRELLEPAPGPSAPAGSPPAPIADASEPTAMAA
jgi:hypothetical protein